MTGFSTRAYALALFAGLVTADATASFAHESAEHNCATVGQWVTPTTGDARAYDQVIESALASPIVMLGEVHPHVEHHRWQLAVISALHGRNPEMAIGFEAFPRAVQPTLDRWIAGELSEDAFLDQTAWTKNWGFDPELYLPMFHFARLHQVPIFALNVERDFVDRIRDEGLAKIPQAERRGLTEPKPLPTTTSPASRRPSASISTSPERRPKAKPKRAMQAKQPTGPNPSRATFSTTRAFSGS